MKAMHKAFKPLFAINGFRPDPKAKKSRGISLGIMNKTPKIPNVAPAIYVHDRINGPDQYLFMNDSGDYETLKNSFFEGQEKFINKEDENTLWWIYGLNDHRKPGLDCITP